MNKNYRIDYFENTITCSADFLRKASIRGTNEYNEMLGLRKELEGFTFKKVAAFRSNRKPNNNKNMTYENMVTYIIGISKDQDDEKTKLADFERIKKLSLIKSSPYKYVVDWFLNNYPDAASNKAEEAEAKNADAPQETTQNNVTSMEKAS